MVDDLKKDLKKSLSQNWFVLTHVIICCPGMFLLFLTVQEGVVIISGLDLGKAQKGMNTYIKKKVISKECLIKKRPK